MRSVHPYAWLPVASIAFALAAVLALVSARYGYHRDELYFLACGRHLAWGYPDQPPLVPLIARAMTSISSSSVAVLRIPAELATAATCALTAAIARELGSSRAGQVLAALVIAVSSVVLATGHLLSTTTFLITCWAALLLISLRALRTGDPRWWLAFGATAGVGLLDSDLVAFLVAAIVVGILLAGPRRIMWSPWAAAGVVVAAALWTPYLVWQAQHGWPQLTVAQAIAHGGSGTSAPRWQIVVMQFVLCAPPLVPVWIAGLVALLRGPRLRWCRCLGIAYFVLLAAFLITGGKPYYLAAMFPLLVGAGAEPTLAWARRRSRVRPRIVGAAVVLAAIPNMLITLPIVPLGSLHSTPIVAVNYDAGETVAWPTYVQQIARSYAEIALPQRRDAVILARNYGEAGALQRFGPAYGLTRVYSGHNAFWLWGPPPETTTTVLAVGLKRDVLDTMFAHVQPAGVLDNRLGIDDDEQGVSLWRCFDPRAPWGDLWPRLRRYG